MQGVADDDGDDGEAAGEASEGAEVVAGGAFAAAFAFERKDGLGGEAEFVGDGDADAGVADIEGEIAGDGGGVQVCSSFYEGKASDLGLMGTEEYPLVLVSSRYNQNRESLGHFRAS